MTSDEILATEAIARSTNGWLREVAYQLALLNEKPAAEPTPVKTVAKKGDYGSHRQG